jgi:hypothetical protein
LSNGKSDISQVKIATAMLNQPEKKIKNTKKNKIKKIQKKIKIRLILKEIKEFCLW